MNGLQVGGMLFHVLVCCLQCTDSGDRVLFIPFILALVIDAISTLFGAKHLEKTREMEPKAPITRTTVEILAKNLLSQYGASQKEHESHTFAFPLLTHQ